MSDTFYAVIIGHKTARRFADQLDALKVPVLAREIRPHKHGQRWITYHYFRIQNEYEADSDSAYRYTLGESA